MDVIFRKARLRYVLLVVFVAALVPYILVLNMTTLQVLPLQLSLGSSVVDVVSQLTVLAALWLIWCGQSTPGAMFGRLVSAEDARRLALLGIPLVAVSTFTAYLVFLPLSYARPVFVETWLLDMPELVVAADRPNALLTNLVSAGLTVVIVPVVEELLFRGFMLGRLGAKYGFGRAIVISSIVFGLLHADPIGAFLFGVIVALIRLKYDSLIAPIIVHMSNNAIVVLWSVFDLLVRENPYQYTLEEFHQSWWWAPLGLVVGAPWLYRYYQKELVQVRWPGRQAT